MDESADNGDDQARERFDDLCFDLVGTDTVTAPPGGSGFGRTALRSDGKIFAMLVRGKLVVKLPAGRVDDLVGAGDGVRFDANKGTPMKEWFALDPASDRAWLPLAKEALEFARAKPKPKTTATRSARIPRKPA